VGTIIEILTIGGFLVFAAKPTLAQTEGSLNPDNPPKLESALPVFGSGLPSVFGSRLRRDGSDNSHSERNVGRLNARICVFDTWSATCDTRKSLGMTCYCKIGKELLRGTVTDDQLCNFRNEYQFPCNMRNRPF
jgi:hypothetical protein